MNPAIQQSSGEASGEQMSPNQPKTTSSVVDALTRAVRILDELDVLPELVDEIGAAIDSCRSNQRDDCLATSINELMHHRLRIYSEAMARLLDRLDRLDRLERLERRIVVSSRRAAAKRPSTSFGDAAPDHWALGRVAIWAGGG